jgi:putative transposase
VRSQFDRRVEKFVRELGIDRPIPVAIDWHDVMYYGKATDMVIGTQHKDGSCHAYEFLTASILVDKQRLIIAVMPVDSRRGKLRLVKPILGRMKRLGLKIRYIAFDKGFLSNELLKYLEDEGIKYILHFPARKKTEGIERDSRIAYKTNNHRDYKNNLEFDLVCAYDEGEEREYLFATNLHYSPKRILDLFKSRWGIETGYRMANQFLIKTTSKNYGVRLCYYMFACLMYNCWVMYNFSKGHTTVIGIKLCLILSTALGVDNVIGSDYI